MVAYNFQAQFADAVASGAKRQTIRATGKRRHARAGDPLQLYTGMRSKSCRKLLDAVCVQAVPVHISEDGAVTWAGSQLPGAQVASLALQDGFQDVAAFLDFFRTQHGLPFQGVCISW